METFKSVIINPSKGKYLLIYKEWVIEDGQKKFTVIKTENVDTFEEAINLISG